MDARALAARPASWTKTFDATSHLPDDVEFREPIEPAFLVRDGRQFRAGALRGLPDRMQPVIDQAATLAADGGATPPQP